MFFKPVLVQFANGKFGVRRFWFFGWHFADLSSPRHSWLMRSQFFRDCMGDREIAEKHLDFYRYQIVQEDTPNG